MQLLPPTEHFKETLVIEKLKYIPKSRDYLMNLLVTSTRFNNYKLMAKLL